MFRRQRSDRQGGKDDILLSLHPGQRSDRHPLPLVSPTPYVLRRSRHGLCTSQPARGQPARVAGGVERVGEDSQPQKKLESRMDNTQMK